jgi:hypothetical protein
MTVSGESNILEARTTFQNLVSNAFLENRSQGLWERFASKFGADGLVTQIPVPLVGSLFERWVGDKVARGIHMLSVDVPFDKLHATKVFQRSQVEHDNTGATEMALNAFLRDQGYLWDQLTFDTIASNAVGPDGVALLADAHPHGANGATWDNLTTDALSHEAVKVGRAAMQELQDIDGNYLSIVPDTLLVSPTDERLAREIFEADIRVFGVAGNGAVDSGTRIAAAGATNVYEGAGTVVVTPRMTGSGWRLVDSRFPCIGIVSWRDPEAVILDRKEDLPRFMRDELHYSIESDANAKPIHPWSIYGAVS